MDATSNSGHRKVGLPTPKLGRAALFLDFDGTLVDIAATPEGVVVPDTLPDILDRLLVATGGATALVSGRSVGSLLGFLPDFTGTVVGSHGGEFRRNGALERHPAAGSPDVTRMTEAAERFAAGVDGLRVEKKPAGVVLHYRQVPKAETRVRAFALGLVERHDGFETHHAKMAFEIRPVDVGKEKALVRLLDAPPFKNRIPIYFGDDATDELAMAEVARLGGLAVKVGEGNTAAPHRVDAPEDVRRILGKWLEPED